MDNRNELGRRLALAKAENRLYDGLLAHAPSVGATKAKWHVISTLRPDILQTLIRGGSSLRILSEVVGRDERNAFWVLACQVASVQHRFLLPLVGATVGRLISGLSDTGLDLLMCTALNAPFVEAHVDVSPDIHQTLSALHQEKPDMRQVMSEQGATIAQLLAPGFLTPIEGLPPPGLISVSSVLPPEMDLVLAQVAAGSDRPASH